MCRFASGEMKSGYIAGEGKEQGSGSWEQNLQSQKEIGKVSESVLDGRYASD
jgi:hypothetical protein